MIRERVNAGLARARERATVLGRRRTRSAVEDRIRDLRSEGMGILKIGRTLGIGTSVVQRVIAGTGEGSQVMEEDGRSALRAVRELRVSIPAAMDIQLRTAAERRKVSVSEYARRALQRALQHDEQRSDS